MFVKMSLRDRVICFADFAGMTLLFCLPYANSLPPMAPFLFLQPVPNCFPRVCLRTIFAAVLKVFLPLTTSANSGTATSNKSAPTRFADGTIYLRKNWIAVLPITCEVHQILVHLVDQHLYRMEALVVLEQPSCNVFYVRNECWKLFWKSKQDEWYRQIQTVFFHRSCLSSQYEHYEKNFWAAVWIAGC